MNSRPNIALTAGCLNGIGPEIINSAVDFFSGKCNFDVYGNDCSIADVAEDVCGLRSFQALEKAVESVVNKKNDAVVTGPINKKHWKLAGLPYTGHTEYLAAKTNSHKYAMMMASPRLKVTLATIHESVRNLPEALNAEKIVTASELTYSSLIKHFGVLHPKLAIAAFNPHCSDNGLFGNEEETIIKPAIQILKNKGIDADGPFPADSVFSQAAGGKFDAVIAMYHDQGLAAIKTLDYKNTVNITLGIPIIRTSVDHGTAEDIAGKGIADNTNLINAINIAITMVKHNRGEKDDSNHIRN